MFSIDDRAGNAVTTVAVFVAVLAMLYLARVAFLVLLLALLFAYLIEPAITWVQNHSRLGRKNRTWAIAQVYLLGALVLGSLGYKFGPRVAAQFKNLSSAVPEILQGLSSGRTVADLEGRHSLSAALQLRIQDALVRHHEFIVRAFEQGAEVAAYAVASTIWLFAIAILAIFILQDGRQMADAMVEAAGQRGKAPRFRRILQRVDTMLAKYVRAQLALAGLSFGFYSLSMLVLKFPYAIALGLMGGVLEFLPAVGWIASAAVILTIGYLTHSHWIWMAGLVVVWRLVQNYVNSPRIMGKTLELQPLTVVFALMAGAEVGGITGVYLSVPVVAVLRIVSLECFSSQNCSGAQSDLPIVEAAGEN
jgi:predicted PurR-regulated permease PerM